MTLKKALLGLVIVLATGLIALIYKLYNPLLYNYFPPCPIKHTTGFDCPTCGTQRALHLFLNGEFKAAFVQNPLVFLIIPYLLLWAYLKLLKNPSKKEKRLYDKLYDNTALSIVLVIVVIFTIWRNIP